jgi:hypothetical protein
MHAKDIKQWLCGITLEEDPKKGARQCWGRGYLAPPHWPHPGGLDAGQNPTTINLGDCGVALKGWWRLTRYWPPGANLGGGGVHHRPAIEPLIAP